MDNFENQKGDQELDQQKSTSKTEDRVFPPEDQDDDLKLLLQKESEIKIIQKRKELHDQQKVEEEIDEILTNVRRSINTKLDSEFQHELSNQLNLVYYLRTKNDPVLLKFVKTAISILIGTNEDNKTQKDIDDFKKTQSENTVNSKLELPNNLPQIPDITSEKNKEKSRIRKFFSHIWFERKQPKNLLIAKKLRKQVEVTLSSDKPQPLFLILGLGSFIVLFGLLPLTYLLWRELSEAPVVTIIPDSMENFTVSSNKAIRLKLGENKENPIPIKANLELKEVSVLSSTEFKNIVEKAIQPIAEDTRKKILDGLSKSISDSVVLTIADEEIERLLEGYSIPQGSEISQTEIQTGIREFLEEDGKIDQIINKIVDDQRFRDAITPEQIKIAVSQSIVTAIDDDVPPQTNIEEISQAQADPRSNFFESLNINVNLFLVVMLGGACGSFTSVILRAQNASSQASLGRLFLFLTGFLKPITGIMFAVFLFAALESNIFPINLKTEVQGQPVNRVYLYLALSFIAGFSERLVQDVLMRTEQTVAGSSRSQDSRVD